MKRSFLTLLLMLSIFGVEVFAKEWNRIVPCVSTRADAEKILGRDGFPAPDVLGSYRYKSFRVSIYYERRDKTAPDTDINTQIDVYPKKSILLAKYVKNIPNFPNGFRKIELPQRLTHLRYLAHKDWGSGM